MTDAELEAIRADLKFGGTMVGNAVLGKYVPALLSENDELRRENEMLKRIACRVPARVYIKAREDAGFGTPIILLGDVEPKEGSKR